MKIFPLLSFTLLCHLPLHAQRAEAYTDVTAFRDNKFTLLDGVYRDSRTDMGIAMSGGNYTQITSDVKATARMLKKDYWAVRLNDTLYVNCRVLMKVNGYAQVLHETKDHLYFKATPRPGTPAANNAMMMGVFGGAIGGAMASVDMAKNRYHYLTFLNSGETMVLNPKNLKWLLRSRGDSTLLHQFEKADPDTVTYIHYLNELQKK